MSRKTPPEMANVPGKFPGKPAQRAEQGAGSDAQGSKTYGQGWKDYGKSVLNELGEEIGRQGQAIINLPGDIADKGIFGTFAKSIVPGAVQNLKMHGRNIKGFFKALFNHPEWYGKYPEFITNNLNWGVRKEAIGFPVAVGCRVGMKLTIPQKHKAVAQSYVDAINAIFIKVRGSNSGAFNYTAEDVAAYVECVRTIIGLHANLVRDISLVNNVDPYIARTPDGLLNLAGYNATSIADMKLNKANYVSALNQAKNAIEAAFPIMPDLAILQRTKFIAKAIIEEGKGPKSSVYLYTLLSGVTAATGSGNEGKVLDVQLSNASFAVRLALLETLISNAHAYVSATYSNYDTFAKIAGDILKAYGSSGFYTLDVATLNDKAEVVFDEYMLHQIQNTQGAQVIDTLNLTAATAPFSYTYTGKVGIPGNTSNSVNTFSLYGVYDRANNKFRNIPVNTDKSAISGLEAISLTRNIAILSVNTGVCFYGATVNAEIWDVHADMVQSLTWLYFKSDNTGFDVEPIKAKGKVALNVTDVSLWSQVDYSPCMQLFDDSISYGTDIPVLDIDTYALMTREQVEIFNDTCILSLYKTINIQDQVNFRAVKR